MNDVIAKEEPTTRPREALAEIIRERGLRHGHVARLAGIPQSSLSSILTGKRPLSPAYAVKLAYALGLPLDSFLATPAEPRSTVSTAGRASQSPSTNSVARPAEPSHLEDDAWDVK
ncbi:MAG: helix-turn-helix transcriptional regulator [Patescibacteria group bacterium]|nr:helix-turn-helix transcriptional regulator [Patescibacteria group bacterium]